MFVLGMAISGAAVSAILLLWFGPAMLFQMLVVPLNQPWQVPELPAPLALWHAVQWLWYWSNPVGWILLAGLVIAIGVSRADPARWREWLDGNPWILPMLGAVCVLPTSAIASAKWGGAWNNAVPGASMALLAAVGALGNAASRGHWDAPNRPGLPPLGRLARVALLGLVLAACWIPVSGFSQLVDGLRTWKRLSDNDHEAAFRYAREHPGEIYFPCHPLSPLLAEGKAYHFQAGLDDLRVAGLAMSEANFRAWLPPRMRAVAFRPRQAQWVRDVLARLPEFRRMVRIPELHEWILLTRDQ
jgi:hypothetical protein